LFTNRSLGRAHLLEQISRIFRFLFILTIAITFTSPDRAFASPGAVTISSLSGGNGYITVGFTGGSNAAKYNYQVSIDNSTWSTPAEVTRVSGASDLTSPLNIDGLTNGISYYVRIITVDSSNATATSAVFGSTVLVSARTAYSGTGASTNAYLMGTYAEVGVRANGAFGSTQPIPSGFHGNVGNCLGFRVDRSFDGWGNSTDDGDFFCPGSPYEGWQIKVGNTGTSHNSCDSVAGVSGTFSELSSSDGNQSVKWSSTKAVTGSSINTSDTGIRITQVSTVPDSSQVLHVDITLTNNSSSTLTDIYYGRSFDPDNSTGPGTFTSTNTVVSRSSPAEVKSTWTNGSLISMKSTDANARAARRDSAFGCNEDPKNIYEAPTGSTANGWTSTSTPNTADSGTGIGVYVNSLSANSSYTFRISYVLSDNAANLPGTPVIDALTPSSGEISVAFTAANNNPTNYDYSLDNGSTWTTPSTPDTSTPIVIGGLTNGTLYTVKLRGRNSFGTGPASNALSATPVGKPSPPILTSLVGGNQSITVSLSPGANGGSALTNYQYALSSDGTTWGSFAALSPPDTSTAFTLTGLTNNTVYFVKVKAVNAVGISDGESNVVSTRTATTPSAPTIDTVTASSGALTISFTPGGSGGSVITKHEYSLDNGSTWETATVLSSPFVITGLTNGTTYSLKMRAVNAIGNGTASTMVSGSPFTVPGAPSFTGAITPSGGTLGITIVPGNTGGSAITGYQYSTDRGATWRDRQDSGGTSTSLTINNLSTDGTTALANGTEYCVQIRAVNLAGAGSASADTCGTPATSPAAPSITSITSLNGALDVAFNFGSNGGNAVTDVEYSSDNGSNWTSAASTVNRVRIIGLTNGNLYQVKIRAVNNLGAGASSSVSEGIPSTTPDAPVIGTVIPSSQKLTVEFVAGLSGGSAITNYQYSLDGGANWTTRSPISTVSPLVISGLTNDTTYQFQLRAVNANGSGASTGTSVASTPRLIADAPTINSVTAGANQLSVAFTAGSDNGSAITNFEFSTDNGATWQVRTPTSTTSPLVITGLTNGTTYTIRLRAINGAGSGAQSSGSTGIPFTTPSAPTISGITDAGGGSLDVAFTPGANGGNSITNYQFSTNAGGTWSTRSPSATTSPLTITGLTGGQLYNIKIRAVNDAGAGTASATVEATPTASDSTAPTFSSAAVGGDGTVLVMTYNEALSATTAATSTFAVTVGGVARTVSSVAISGSTVRLTLASAVLNGQTVTVAYTDPSGSNDANAVQDSAGNDAATLSATSVTNNVADSTAPTFSSAAVGGDGTVLVMTYNEALSATTAATSTFAVTVGGAARTVSSVAISGSTVRLTLASAVLNGQTVTVAYTDPSGSNDANAVQDSAGNDAATLSATSVTNNVGIVTGNTPSFSSIMSLETGFTVTITNYDPLFTYSVSVPAPASVTISNTGVIVVVGLSGFSTQTTLTVTTTRLGYAAESVSLVGSTKSAPPPPNIVSVLTPPTLTLVSDTLVCEIGTFEFIRASITKEIPKLSIVVFTLIIGKERVSQMVVGSESTPPYVASSTQEFKVRSSSSSTQAVFEVGSRTDILPAQCEVMGYQENALGIGNSNILAKTIPNVIWPAIVPITASTKVGVGQLNAVSDVEGTFVYSIAPGSSFEVGKYTLTVTFTPKDIDNYDVVVVKNQLRVLTASTSIRNSITVQGSQQTIAIRTSSGVLKADPEMLLGGKAAAGSAGFGIQKISISGSSVTVWPMPGFSGKTSLALVQSGNGGIINIVQPLNVASTGVSLVNVNVLDFVKPTLSWSAVQGATSYLVSANGVRVCSSVINTCIGQIPLGPKSLVSITVNGKDLVKTTTQPKVVVRANIEAGSINFGSGEPNLSGASRAGLLQVARLIRPLGYTKLTLIGHTDSDQGVDNSKLSQDRAKAVLEVLQRLLPGVSISIKGQADSAPVASNNTEAGKAKNRRVEIRVVNN
jgi:uncharacterized repeat protein (TIGR02059 family)